ncbi:MAG: bifunctional (p)ppGpp synthetase/guanosine-3',5'-bis(diphosphate) 3'-pyrophosphohydrolase [Bacteroidetes bacterium]|nr:MAG: bifunctional (p)ppGpp synthetase/guanosine-3',5'-bis(diphosphate) 3'-pyrophosphohydrolase [Bacteroidota bacterium]
MLQALTFAADKHRDQRGKDRRLSPYINHLIDVANLLWHTGGVRDRDTLVAGILHDTLEDTETTPEEIALAFGETVLGYVQEVTDDKSLPKAVRKQQQIDHAPHKSVAAAQIKIADKSANLHDILMHPPDGWPQARRQDYVRWARAVVSALPPVNPGLEAHFASIADRADREL